MGCAASKPDVVDPPPYVRHEERRSPNAERDIDIDMLSYATKIKCLQCYICGKKIQNDKISIDVHYVYCDEVHQTPPDWDKYGVVYDKPTNLKRRCKTL